jgi:hypothetical protein
LDPIIGRLFSVFWALETFVLRVASTQMKHTQTILPQHRVMTLDEVVRQNSIAAIDFLKLDTQGSELAILQGALYCLAGVVGVKVEVEFIETYRAQPLFAEVDIFMRQQGFQLYDLKRYFWKRNSRTKSGGKGQLIFADALYFRSLDSLSNLLVQQDRVVAVNKLLKLMVACLIYGASDYALDVLTSLSMYFSPKEQSELISLIQKNDNQLSLLLHRLYMQARFFLKQVRSRFLPDVMDWAESDPLLGNRYL